MIPKLPGPLNSLVKWPFHHLFQTYYSLRARLRRRAGVDPSTQEPRLIVTLTSHPPRFGALHMCIESLLSQSLRPAKIVLWIGDNAGALPAALLRLQQYGLEIRLCEDVGPLTKVVHALQQYPDEILVTADDDNIYPRWWLKELADSYREFPGTIQCHRAMSFTLASDGTIAPYDQWNYGAVGVGPQPSMLLVPTGVSGVLYPPGSLHPDVLDIPAYRALSPTNDDWWLKVMSMRTGTGCRLIGGRSRDFYIIPRTQERALWKTNEFGPNTSQIDALLKHYGLTTFFQGRQESPRF